MAGIHEVRGSKGRELGGFLGEGQPARGLGSAVSSPEGCEAESRPPSGFPTFEVLGKTFPDTSMVLLLAY